MIMLIVAALFAMSVVVPVALAAPLSDDCQRVNGKVTCTTFEGPGNNQAGVGETTETETQGNTTNKKPAPQELKDSDSCNPESSKGKPCNP